MKSCRLKHQETYTLLRNLGRTFLGEGGGGPHDHSLTGPTPGLTGDPLSARLLAAACVWSPQETVAAGTALPPGPSELTAVARFLPRGAVGGPNAFAEGCGLWAVTRPRRF